MVDVSYSLLIDGNPISSDLLSYVRSLEIEDHASLADILRLRLSLGVADDGSGLVPLDEDLFSRLTNITVKVSANGGDEEVLIDSYVVAVDANVSNEPDSSTMDIIAMDPTVLMNLEDKVRPWPDMAKSDIASTIFDECGFEPDVESTSNHVHEGTIIQRGTDIQFLKELAGQLGFECYVEVDPVSGTREGHFHPPRLDLNPQIVLNVNMGPSTNVRSFRAKYDMMMPNISKASGVDAKTIEAQTCQADRPSWDLLGGDLTPSENQCTSLLTPTAIETGGELQAYAQANVNRHAFAITAIAEVEGTALPSILRSKRTLLVRGVGQMFSGIYYVEKVLHTFDRDGHMERLQLRRNGVGLTGSENFAED